VGPYLDNPIHVAELRDLSRADFNGWSGHRAVRTAAGVLPFAALVRLAGLLHRTGVPLAFCSGVLLCAFAAPASAVYVVARRRLAPFRPAP